MLGHHQCKTESATCKATKVVLSARFAILNSGRTKMSKSLLLMISILTGLLVLACGKSAETNRNANTTAPSNTTAPAPAATASTNRNGNDGATATTKIGVEECDSFLTAYDNCVSTKIPEAARAQYRTSLNTLRTEWKKLADNPQTRGTLAAACKTQHEQVRAQVKSFGCTL